MVGIKRNQQLKCGDRIGAVVLVERAEDFEGESDVRPQWIIKCDCGHQFKMVNRTIRRKSFNRKNSFRYGCDKCRIK